MTADAGEIWFDGERIDGLRPLAARAPRARPHLPDHPALPRDDRAGERRRPAAAPSRGAARPDAVSGQEAERADGAAASSSACGAFARRSRRGALSYGQQKLVELAQVLMLEPQADPARRARRRHQPDADRADGRDDPRAQRARATTFLIVEHNMPFVLGLCDPVHVLARGTCDRPGHARRRSSDDPACSTPTSARSGRPSRSAPASRRPLLLPEVHRAADATSGRLRRRRRAAGRRPRSQPARSRASSGRTAPASRPCCGSSAACCAAARGRSTSTAQPIAGRAPGAILARGVAQVPQSHALFPQHDRARERAHGRLHRSAATRTLLKRALRRGRGAVPDRRASAPTEQGGQPVRRPAADGRVRPLR